MTDTTRKETEVTGTPLLWGTATHIAGTTFRALALWATCGFPGVLS